MSIRNSNPKWVTREVAESKPFMQEQRRSKDGATNAVRLDILQQSAPTKETPRRKEGNPVTQAVERRKKQGSVTIVEKWDTLRKIAGQNMANRKEESKPTMREIRSTKQKANSLSVHGISKV